MSGELRVPLQAELVVTVEDPNDPGVAMIVAALQEHGSVSVPSVTVAFPGLLQQFWEQALADGRVEIEFRVPGGTARESSGRPRVAAEVVGTDLLRQYIYREGDGPVWFDFKSADGNGLVLRWVLVALGMPDDPQTSTALRALSRIEAGFHDQIWGEPTGERINLTRLAELVRSDEKDDFWFQIRDNLRNMGKKRVELVVRFADRDWEALVASW